MVDDNVKFEKTSFPSSVPPETKFRTTVSTEVGNTDAEIQHVILDAGDGTAPTLGLPTDAATETKQDDLITELKLKADLTETQPVSAATLPLPSGAATSAIQIDGTQQAKVKETAPTDATKNNGSTALLYDVNGDLQYIDETIAGTTYRTTLTYTARVLNGISAAVAQ